MIMGTGLRRLTFTTHITSSVGWVGAVMAFLALAVIALTSEDDTTVRGAYLVMAPAAWFVLVPLAHASLLSGIAISLGTPWGLFRHYWVVLKLLITAFATVILLIYMGTFREMAGVAADPVIELGLVRNPSPVVHAILALVLLVTATVLGVYKPFGMTSYGNRAQSGRRQAVALTVETHSSHANTGLEVSRWHHRNRDRVGFPFTASDWYGFPPLASGYFTRLICMVNGRDGIFDPRSARPMP